MIGKIATELGANDINLSNLEIIENRVDVPGIMRLVFPSGRGYGTSQDFIGFP